MLCSGRAAVKSIRTIGRNTQGVRVMNAAKGAEGAKVSAVARAVGESKEEEVTEEEVPEEEADAARKSEAEDLAEAENAAAGDEIAEALEQEERAAEDLEGEEEDEGATETDMAEALEQEKRLAEINSRTEGWVYAIPEYQYEQFTRMLEDLLEPLEDESDDN